MAIEMRLPEDFGPSWLGWRTFYGTGFSGEWSPYLFRLVVGRLRLHVFYRGDADPDPHDHPWNFWTFPLTPYVEEVCTRIEGTFLGYEPSKFERSLNIVPAFRFSYRPATYLHRVLGRLHPYMEEFLPEMRKYPQSSGVFTNKKPVVTLVWSGKSGRKWGFMKLCEGFGEWISAKKYIEEGGKTAPCAEETPKIEVEKRSRLGR